MYIRSVSTSRDDRYHLPVEYPFPEIPSIELIVIVNKLKALKKNTEFEKHKKKSSVSIMKTKILILITILLASSFKKEQDPRKTNFPKTIELVEEMPKPENFWIFVLAGQSNMAGRGFVEPKDTISNKRILTINSDDQWVYAKEPLHFYEPNLTGLDCGLSFANTLLENVPEEVSIGIIPCSVGGSAIEQWLNDETYRGVQLLSNFKSKVAFAQKKGIVKGILWHQGESNAKSELIPEYEANLKKLTTTFRTFVKNDSLPLFIGQLGSYASPIQKSKRWNSINSKISDFAKSDNNIHVINTQDLEHKGDTVHFDSKSQRLMGKRFALKYVETANPNL